GMVLGPTSNATYGRGFLYLEPGDSIIAFSDGITEAKNGEGEDYGDERVKEFIRTHYDDYNAGQMVDRLLDDVAIWSKDGDYTDDRTVVFVKRL
ncbi:MAG: serine/threonine-protein phosphatase, partial [Acidobacteria bacterium]|nr:serine/threonine-protein phosphatase [Acidobacteriota bacterium]